jgi:transglutaminase-like putative cysteine protease
VGWLLLLLVAAGALLTVESVDARVRDATEKAAWALLSLQLALTLWWLVSTDGQSEPTPPLPPVLAFAAPLLAVLFLAGRRVWVPHRTLIPACIVTVVLAASRARIKRSLLVPVLIIFATAAGLLLADGPGANSRERALRFFLSALAAGAAAAGITTVLRAAQPLVLQLASQAAFGDAETGFSPETRLGGAEELTPSERVVMRVWASEPRKLRASVSNRFDGKSWTFVAGVEHAVAPLPAGVRDPVSWPPGVEGHTFLLDEGPTDSTPRNEDVAICRVRLVMLVPGSIPVPARPDAIRLSAVQLKMDSAGLLRPALDPGALYAVQPGSTAPAASFGQEDLGVPENLDRRLRDLASDLRSRADTDELRVGATLDWLQTHVHYSLKMGRFNSGQPLAEFLFEKKQGWCEYFASSAAVLLRLEGVPTRYVKGFNVRPSLRRGGHFVVREADAHAWIEAWLPGRGWVEFDPTPSAEYDSAHGEPGLLAGYYEWFVAAWDFGSVTQWRAIPAQLGSAAARLARQVATPSGAAGGLGLAAIGLLVVWLRFRHVKGGEIRSYQEGEPALHSLLSQLDAVWTASGVPRHPSRAPREHIQALAYGALPMGIKELGTLIVDYYYRVRFAGEPPSDDVLRRLQRDLDALRERSA